MSLLPETIPPESLPFGKVLPDGRMIIDHNWYLFLYSLSNHTIGKGILPVANGGTGSNAIGPALANNLGALAIDNNLSDLQNTGAARTNLGLGTMATESASSVAITGGTVSGAAVSSGSISGTTINSTTIGATTPETGAFTTVSASQANLGSATLTGTLQLGSAYTSGAITPTGYLTVKDSSGTTREIPCL